MIYFVAKIKKLSLKRKQMLPSQWKREKIEQLKAQKTKVHRKISNNFIESAIQRNNINTLKTIFYLASKLRSIDSIQDKKGREIVEIILDKDEIRKMLQYTEMTMSDLVRNVKAMQQTSITFINEFEQWEEGMSLLPLYKINYGRKQSIEINIFVKIAKLIIDVKKNYTMIDTKKLMQFKSKHTLRFLPLLQRIGAYQKNVDMKNAYGSYTTIDVIAKRKKFTLDDLNDFFGTKYKTLYDLERKVLLPIKRELDLLSRTSFVYDINFDNFGRGRPKAVSITIDVIDNSNNLFTT